MNSKLHHFPVLLQKLSTSNVAAPYNFSLDFPSTALVTTSTDFLASKHSLGLIAKHSKNQPCTSSTIFIWWKRESYILYNASSINKVFALPIDDYAHAPPLDSSWFCVNTIQPTLMIQSINEPVEEISTSTLKILGSPASEPHFKSLFLYFCLKKRFYISVLIS